MSNSATAADEQAVQHLAGTTVLFVLYQTAPSTMVVERATLHAQKLDLQDLATHSADAPKRLAMLGVRPGASHQRAAAVLLSPLFQTGSEALRRAASFPLGYDVLGAQQSLGQERGMGGGRLWCSGRP